jgi:hypothetical protein
VLPHALDEVGTMTLVQFAGTLAQQKRRNAEHCRGIQHCQSCALVDSAINRFVSRGIAQRHDGLQLLLFLKSTRNFNKVSTSWQ